MPLRILHLDAGREWRGGQRQVMLLANGLRERGLEPLVVSPPNSPLIHRLHDRGIAASAIAMRSDWDLAAARRLRTLIRTWRPDIVHAHDARSHAVALLALFRRADVPLIVTRRVAIEPKHGRIKYGRRVRRFIAISNAVRDALERSGVEPSRISVVYSGVPAPPPVPPRDWRTECGWPADTVICGVVGAMTAEKGFDRLAAIARALPDDLRPRTRLLLLGGRKVGRDSLGGVETFFAGFVDAVQPAMAGLDVLWHPSSSEGLGTVVIDAMALRVPPIAFAVGGLVEIIESDRTGLLVPRDDTRQFAIAAARLIRDGALRRQLGSAGPERARAFEVSRMVDGAMAVYEDVLNAARSAG
jgi:glycosyltransferase involved in cell wall biosynthesis